MKICVWKGKKLEVKKNDRGDDVHGHSLENDFSQVGERQRQVSSTQGLSARLDTRANLQTQPSTTYHRSTSNYSQSH